MLLPGVADVFFPQRSSLLLHSETIGFPGESYVIFFRNIAGINTALLYHKFFLDMVPDHQEDCDDRTKLSLS